MVAGGRGVGGERRTAATWSDSCGDRRLSPPTDRSASEAGGAGGRPQTARIGRRATWRGPDRQPPGGSHLGAPPDRPEAHKLIDLVQLWRTDDSPSAILHWFRRHRPPQSGLNDLGSLIFEGKAIKHVFSFEFGELAPLARGRSVLLSVVPDRGGGTYFRIDSQAEWVTPHPRAERIPLGAGFLKMELITYRTKQKIPVTLTDRTTIRHIAHLINGLPIVGPYARGHEERLTGELKLTFRTREGGKELASVRLQTTPHFGYSVEVTVPKRNHAVFIGHWGGHRIVNELKPLFTGVK